MSSRLGIPLVARQKEGGVLTRHLTSFLWSLAVLVRRKPAVILIQYSYLLLIAVYLYKTISRSKVYVVCDCHTKALRRRLEGRGSKLFEYLKKKSFDCVDLCLIANEGQRADALKYIDRIQVIPDPIPAIHSRPIDEARGQSVVFVCSFDDDEPVSEMLMAAEALSVVGEVYVTGKADRAVFDRLRRPSKVNLTGFLPEDEYGELLQRASCIVSCTTEEGCLQSSGYEALATETPFVTSATQALREYFEDAAVFVDNESKSIRKGVDVALENSVQLRSKLRKLKRHKTEEIGRSLNRLEETIQHCCSPQG